MKKSKNLIKSAALVIATACAFGAITPVKASNVSPKPFSLTIKDAVIDFSPNSDRVTIKCNLENVANGSDTQQFYVRVMITDRRDGSIHDTGDQFPTVVR